METILENPRLNNQCFRLVASIGDDEMSGRQIIAKYEQRFGRITDSAAYEVLRTMRDREILETRKGGGFDQRSVLFKLTEDGREAVAASRLYYATLAKLGLPD